MRKNDFRIRIYKRNILVSLICLAVCLSFDVINFMHSGTLRINTMFFVSIALYALLIFIAIRSTIKVKQLKKEDDEKS